MTTIQKRIYWYLGAKTREIENPPCVKGAELDRMSLWEEKAQHKDTKKRQNG
jgi:hypothetical protein